MDKALSDFDLTRFHMYDFNERIGEFKDWDQARRDACFARLKQIIRSTTMLHVGVALDLKQYHEVFSDEVSARSAGPYGLAVIQLICEVRLNLTQIHRRPNARVAYVFEEGAKEQAVHRAPGSIGELANKDSGIGTPPAF